MKSLALLLALCAVPLVFASPYPGKLAKEGQTDWIIFKAQHGRNYEGEAADAMRMKIFLEYKQRIELFNEHLSKSAGFSLGLNHLSDWTETEKSKLNGFKLTKRNTNTLKADKFLQDILDDPSPVPEEVDWRKVANRVTRVKDQGHCGSCWAFASTGALEGQQVVRRSNGSANAGELVELSEQNILDCTDLYKYGIDHKGCDGATMDDALDLVRQEGGVDSEQSYPYETSNDDCRFDKANVVMTDAGSARLPEGDEEALKKLVATFGPVSVAIDASSNMFYYYTGGVLDYPACKNAPEDLDHAVLVVGYGTDAKQGDFWIVKNSWNEKWGEEGYVRMSRNKKNQCGIATHAIIPIF